MCRERYGLAVLYVCDDSLLCVLLRIFHSTLPLLLSFVVLFRPCLVSLFPSSIFAYTLLPQTTSLYACRWHKDVYRDGPLVRAGRMTL